MISRRAMKRGSSPAATIVASQYSAASGSLPRSDLDERADRVVMAVAGAVVLQDALLGGLLDVLDRGRSRT